MTKQAKILIFFSLVLLVLIAYLILTSESAKKIENSAPRAEKPAAALSEEAARIKVKEIFSAYERLSRDNNFTAEKIAELKSRLFALKGLPANFEKLPLNFVLALNKMEDYLKEKAIERQDESRQIINQLKADYGWLND